MCLDSRSLLICKRIDHPANVFAHPHLPFYSIVLLIPRNVFLSESTGDRSRYRYHSIRKRHSVLVIHPNQLSYQTVHRV